MRHLETIKGNFRFWILDFGFRKSDFGSRISDFVPPSTSLLPRPSSLVLTLAFVLLSLGLFAQGTKESVKPKPTTRILFVFDASQSMYGHWQSDTKFNIAVKLFSGILDSLRTQPNLELALRVYGHQKQFPPQDCNDTRLEVPFGKDNITRIKHVLRTIIPKGTTLLHFRFHRQPTISRFVKIAGTS